MRFEIGTRLAEAVPGMIYLCDSGVHPNVCGVFVSAWLPNVPQGGRAARAEGFCIPASLQNQPSASSVKPETFFCGISVIMIHYLQEKINCILQITYQEVIQQKSLNHGLRLEVILSKYGKRDEKHVDCEYDF